MGKDGPIGRRDPFAQKVIKIAGVSINEPQASSVREFTPSVEEVQSALGLNEKEAGVSVDCVDEKGLPESLKEKGSLGTLNGQNASRRTEVIPQERSWSDVLPEGGNGMLQALNIVTEAGQKRTLSPTLWTNSWNGGSLEDPLGTVQRHPGCPYLPVQQVDELRDQQPLDEPPALAK